jgi:ribonuclease HI
MKHVVIYTDGACKGNPGKGGYGIVLLYGQHRKELSGGYLLTTNNRMEMLAVVVALESLKERCRVTLYTDSRYIVDAITKGWAKSWQRNNWRKGNKEQAKNPDLWQKILDLWKNHEIDIQWVKGHADIPENERADRLAVGAAESSYLERDLGYEAS